MSSTRGNGQYCVLALQILVQSLNACRLRLHRFLPKLLHHLVVNEPLADVPDLNVAAIRFPELPLFQLGKWLCAHFHRGSNPTYRTGFVHSSA
jgi:hypothetical protein